MARAHARLHVLLARDAPVGVVIRRGPSRWTATIGWDRTTDRFTPGQWLHGRIYADRSDLSTDGKYLIYFASNGRWGGGATGNWPAISGPPFLQALALVRSNGPDHDGGGGLWTGPDTYVWAMRNPRGVQGLDGDVLRPDGDYVWP